MEVEAVHLASLEKLSSNLGKFMFLWATIVLLGGFMDDLHRSDFYMITAVLVSYGVRSFSFHHLARAIKKPRVFSKVQAFGIIYSVLTFLIVFGVSVKHRLISLPFVALLGYLLSAKPWVFLAELYIVEFFLALLNFGGSIHWSTQLQMPKGNREMQEFVAMFLFLYTAVMESSLFLANRCLLHYRSLRESKKNRPRFLLETQSKFFDAVYQATLKDGALKGLEMRMVDYVAQKFLDSRSSRQLSESMLMLDAVSGIEVDRKNGNSKYLSSNREVVDRLFQCMSKSYFLVYRRAAISLVARFCEDVNGFFYVAQAIYANSHYISLLLDALWPDTSKTVLELLKCLAEFQGVVYQSSDQAGVMEDFDFSDETTYNRWKSSILDNHGEDDSMQESVEEQDIQNCRQRTARAIRNLLRSQECMSYLANASTCPSQELREIALGVSRVLSRI